MKKIIVCAAIFGMFACSKDTATTQPNNQLRSETPGPAVALPENDATVEEAVEDFYSAYATYDAGNYNQNTSPDYKVGYGYALLEAAINAYYFTSGDSYSVEYDEANAITTNFTATFDDDDVAYVSEYALLVAFGDIMTAISTYDMAPASDVQLMDAVAVNGAFQLRFVPAIKVSGSSTPIGTDGDYYAGVSTKCDGSGTWGSVGRLEAANSFRYLGVWFYNAETFYCHNYDGTHQPSGW
jgi:hypothetical protein